ncbi:hypothetical protein DIPPA_07518 [Diplonema papillatum]|nr:hypothetical protein DIPPA_07518 [Diplonema papillatum]
MDRAAAAAARIQRLYRRYAARLRALQAEFDSVHGFYVGLVVRIQRAMRARLRDRRAAAATIQRAHRRRLAQRRLWDLSSERLVHQFYAFVEAEVLRAHQDAVTGGSGTDRGHLHLTFAVPPGPGTPECTRGDTAQPWCSENGREGAVSQYGGGGAAHGDGASGQPSADGAAAPKRGSRGGAPPPGTRGVPGADLPSAAGAVTRTGASEGETNRQREESPSSICGTAATDLPPAEGTASNQPSAAAVPGECSSESEGDTNRWSEELPPSTSGVQDPWSEESPPGSRGAADPVLPSAEKETASNQPSAAEVVPRGCSSASEGDTNRRSAEPPPGTCGVPDPDLPSSAEEPAANQPSAAGTVARTCSSASEGEARESPLPGRLGDDELLERDEVEEVFEYSLEGLAAIFADETARCSVRGAEADGRWRIESEWHAFEAGPSFAKCAELEETLQRAVIECDERDDLEDNIAVKDVLDAIILIRCANKIQCVFRRWKYRTDQEKKQQRRESLAAAKRRHMLGRIRTAEHRLMDEEDRRSFDNDPVLTDLWSERMAVLVSESDHFARLSSILRASFLSRVGKQAYHLSSTEAHARAALYRDESATFRSDVVSSENASYVTHYKRAMHRMLEDKARAGPRASDPVASAPPGDASGCAGTAVSDRAGNPTRDADAARRACAGRAAAAFSDSVDAVNALVRQAFKAAFATANEERLERGRMLGIPVGSGSPVSSPRTTDGAQPLSDVTRVPGWEVEERQQIELNESCLRWALKGAEAECGVAKDVRAAVAAAGLKEVGEMAQFMDTLLGVRVADLERREQSARTSASRLEKNAWRKVAFDELRLRSAVPPARRPAPPRLAALAAVSAPPPRRAPDRSPRLAIVKTPKTIAPPLLEKERTETEAALRPRGEDLTMPASNMHESRAAREHETKTFLPTTPVSVPNALRFKTLDSGAPLAAPHPQPNATPRAGPGTNRTDLSVTRYLEAHGVSQNAAWATENEASAGCDGTPIERQNDSAADGSLRARAGFPHNERSTGFPSAACGVGSSVRQSGDPFSRKQRGARDRPPCVTVKEVTRSTARTATLDLQPWPLTEQDIRNYLVALCRNKGISVLKLGGHPLSMEHCLLLADLISQPSCGLVSIRLDGCRLTDETALPIVEAVYQNNTLAVVDLSENPDVSFCVVETLAGFLASRRQAKARDIASQPRHRFLTPAVPV